MIQDLVKEFAESEYHTHTIINAIEHKIGRRLKKGKDRVSIDYVDRTDNNDETYQYGAVIFEGTVYGFLWVDYSEPCLRFVPSPELLPV